MSIGLIALIISYILVSMIIIFRQAKRINDLKDTLRNGDK